MNTISLSEFKKIGKVNIESILPSIVTIDGEPAFLIDKPENIIVVSDLAIRVRHNLKAIEAKVRAAMGVTPTKIYADEITQEPILQES